jgi:hypothetical protein
MSQQVAVIAADFDDEVTGEVVLTENAFRITPVILGEWRRC